MSSHDDWQTRSLPPPKIPNSEGVPLRKIRSFGQPGLHPHHYHHPIKSNLIVKTQRESLQSSWGSSNQEPKTLHWREVNIRQYERTVGDNPSCSSGPPISIGWNYALQSDYMSVDGYEKSKTDRRTHMDLLLSREEREYLLLDEWEVPRTQITEAIRSTIRTKNQRRTTVTNLTKSPILDEVMESVGRKWKRALSFQKRPSIQAASLMEQHLAAQAQRCDIITNTSRRSDQSGTTTTTAQAQAATIQSPPPTTSSKSSHTTSDIPKIIEKSKPKHKVQQDKFQQDKFQQDTIQQEALNFPVTAPDADGVQYDCTTVIPPHDDAMDGEEQQFLSYAEEQMLKQQKQKQKLKNPIRHSNGTALHPRDDGLHSSPDWGFVDDNNEVRPEAATVDSSDTRDKKPKKSKKGRSSTSKKKMGDAFE